MARPRTISNDVVLAAIVLATEQNGYPPSMRELAARLGFKSASSLYPYFVDLCAEGRITWSAGEFRTLRVVDGQHDVLRRPAAAE